MKAILDEYILEEIRELNRIHAFDNSKENYRILEFIAKQLLKISNQLDCIFERQR